MACNERSLLGPFQCAMQECKDIFNDIQTCVNNGKRYFAGRTTIVEQTNVQAMADYCNQVEHIGSAFAENAKLNLKVAVCGSTSNGKSAIINAILGHKILPSKMGAVTKSFMQVVGTDEKAAYIEDGHKHMLIKDANDIDSLNEEGKIITIHWPKRQCRLLEDDVVVVDCPGQGYTRKLNSFINNCQDSDVFVLVVDCVTELRQEEKDFLSKVKEDWSKPNMFVLVNKWDLTVVEEDTDVDKLRENLMKSLATFLEEELRVAGPNKANDYIYFVSAKETLSIREETQLDNQRNERVQQVKGFKERYHNFEIFETKLQECLRDAVQIKFGNRTEKGSQILRGFCMIMDKISKEAANQKEHIEKKKIRASEELTKKSKPFDSIDEEIRNKIEKVVAEVEDKLKQIIEASKVEMKEIDISNENGKKTFGLLENKMNAMRTKAATDGVDKVMQFMKDQYLVNLINTEDKMAVTRVYEQSINCDTTSDKTCDTCEMEMVSPTGEMVCDVAGLVVGAGVTGLVAVGSALATAVVAEAAAVTVAVNVVSAAVGIVTGTTVGSLITIDVVQRVSKPFRNLCNYIPVLSVVNAAGSVIASPVNLTRKVVSKPFTYNTIDKKRFCKQMDGMKQNSSTTCTYLIKAELSNRADQLKTIADGVLKVMKENIELLDNDSKQLDVIISESNSYKKTATVLLEKLDKFTKKYLRRVV